MDVTCTVRALAGNCMGEVFHLAVRFSAKRPLGIRLYYQFSTKLMESKLDINNSVWESTESKGMINKLPLVKLTH